jgi:hypothetical protein
MHMHMHMRMCMCMCMCMWHVHFMSCACLMWQIHINTIVLCDTYDPCALCYLRWLTKRRVRVCVTRRAYKIRRAVRLHLQRVSQVSQTVRLCECSSDYFIWRAPACDHGVVLIQSASHRHSRPPPPLIITASYYPLKRATRAGRHHFALGHRTRNTLVFPLRLSEKGAGTVSGRVNSGCFIMLLINYFLGCRF